MTSSTNDFRAELEKQVVSYLDRIQQIDRIIKRPVNTLIEVSHAALVRPGQCGQGHQHPFPVLLSTQGQPKASYDPLNRALCFSTLQRLWRRRRRFSWLEKKRSEELGGLLKISKSDDGSDNPIPLLACYTPPKNSDMQAYLRLLHNEVFGGLDPLTAAHVFRVLVDGGEAYVHSGVGFLAFFAMVWPLYRKHPNAGARIEPWCPTAYVTANCLLPILGVAWIANRRAKTLSHIAKNVDELNKLKSNADPQSQWQFNSQLDALSVNLLSLSEVAIVKQQFRDCARDVAARSASLSIDTTSEKYDECFTAVLGLLSTALQEAGKQAKEKLGEAIPVINSISETYHNASNCPNPSFVIRILQDAWGVRFADVSTQDSAWQKLYCDDVLLAAKQALELCASLGKSLEQAAKCCSECQNNPKSVLDTLNELAKTNFGVAEHLNDPVDAPARWCKSVVDREIAHASAANMTEFDPSELVSAIAVAIRCKLIPTCLQVNDAISKAVLGVQQDGRWRVGQPFYSPNDSQGIWAGTSDIVSILIGAIEQQPDVRAADEKLFLYLDWLERTLIEIPARRPTLTDQDYEQSESWTGWPSDRVRRQSTIHLATTACSINTLLEIRELIEYRLWELCQKRFTTPPVTIKGLEEADPVDLGATHKKRLHSRLVKMVRAAERDAEEQADDPTYSLVLHGPPGSSKTRLVQALSAEMWKSSRPWGFNGARLIRITPADFTRLGEDRIDSEARLIFELLGHVRGVTILFDEIDDLLRRRDKVTEIRFMDLVVPAMLNRLADLREICPRQEICFLLATNYVENIERALIRKGRFDNAVAVVYPDAASRKAMICHYLQEHGYENLADPAITKEIEDFVIQNRGRPWMTIQANCRELLNALKAKHSYASESVESFSPPNYHERLKRDATTQSPELLDEYLHYVICRCSCDEDLKGERLSFEVLRDDWQIEDLQQRLDRIIQDEKRETRLIIPGDLLNRGQPSAGSDQAGTEASDSAGVQPQSASDRIQEITQAGGTPPGDRVNEQNQSPHKD